MRELLLLICQGFKGLNQLGGGLEASYESRTRLDTQQWTFKVKLPESPLQNLGAKCCILPKGGMHKEEVHARFSCGP